MLKNLNNCTGCSACYNICPIGAITMNENDEGFLKPFINHDKCTVCGLCEKVCRKDKTAAETEPLAVYAAKNINNEIRKNSSSGGVFYAIGEFFLNNGGVVYGVSFDIDFSVKHVRIEKIEELKTLQGSKYVQSEIGYTFRKVKEDLLNDKKVLFSGTPCQISGLLGYLNGIDLTNLTTVDILCHGVASPLVWENYIKTISKSGKEISNISFRNKKIGWHKFCFSYKLKNQSEKTVIFNDNFYCYLYGMHYILRPACYECKYSKYFRESDITIGDFWGIEKIMPQIDDNIGTSVLFLNSNKGEEMISQIDCLEKVQINKEIALKYNISSPSSKPKDRDTFWDDYKNKTTNYIYKHYFENSLETKVKHYIKQFLIKLNYSW